MDSRHSRRKKPVRNPAFEVGNFYELLAKLKELDIRQTEGDWTKDIPKEIWGQYFKQGYKTVKEELDIERYRWYDISTTVIEICGGLLGVSHISNVYSNHKALAKLRVKLVFTEMKAVPTTEYIRI